MQHLKHTLENITGVEIYPLISLLIFFIFFLFLGLYIFFTDKKHCEKMSRVPLDDSENKENSNDESIYES